MALTLQQFKELRAKGLSAKQIADLEAGRVSTKKPSSQIRQPLTLGGLAKDVGGFYKDVLVGGAKGIGSTASGLSSLGQRGLESTIGAGLRKFGIGPEPPKRTAGEIARERFFTPEGSVQKGAFAAEQLAEFFVPSSKIAKFEKTAQLPLDGVKGIRELPGILKKKGGLTLPARAGTEAIAFGGTTAAQTGELGEETRSAALFGGAFPVLGAGLKFTKSKFFTKTVKDVNEIVGKIAQGKKQDIPKFADALSSIETKGVKTYSQLENRINEKVSALATNLDDMLAGKGGILKLKDLKTVTEVGKKKVSHNFIDDAFNHLDELYRKINDPVKLEEIKQLRNKAKATGLSIKDVNDLARVHGREFGEKAFSKRTGEALTSINAKAFENTRKGLKNKSRAIFGDDSAKAVDKEMSSLIKARELTKKMSDKVNDLQQKIDKRGIGEALGRKIFNALDLTTGRSLSGFMRAGFIPRGGGLKTMNALDIEKGLQKRLKELEKIDSYINKKIPTGLRGAISERVFGRKS